MCRRNWADRDSVAHARDADADLVLDLQEKGAGVFHAPVLVGHEETRAGLDVIAALFNLQGQCQVMVGPMDPKYSLHL